MGQSEDGLSSHLELRSVQERGSEMGKLWVIKRGECCLANGTKVQGKLSVGFSQNWSIPDLRE